jgi:cell division protein FtsW (lipid II flippase)
MKAGQKKLSRAWPNFLAIAAIFALSLAGHLAILRAGQLAGYSSSLAVVARNQAFFILLATVLLWLRRRQKFRGYLFMLTAAGLLSAAGLLIQFRIFSDPEYSKDKLAERSREREAKAQVIRIKGILSGYSEEKKRILFGDAEVSEPPLRQVESTWGDFLNRTGVLMAALIALVASFLLFKDDAALLWMQRHSISIGLATLLLLAIAIALRKFLAQTTPWEAAKIPFLVSFAGMLADLHGRLKRTRWGLPPLRYALPLLVIAAMPAISFFALSDFGQMLVFACTYLTLYFVAVRKLSQLGIAALLLLVVVGIFSLASALRTGFGLPDRVYFRFYAWIHLWEPPPIDTWWWKGDFQEYLKKRVKASPELKLDDPDTLRELNEEAWADKVLQPAQGLLAVREGRFFGKGFGLGFPEAIPISDSDYIYAAIAEEGGLACALTVLLAVAAIIIAGTAASLGAPDMFTKLLAAGLTALFGVQSFVNIGGVLRLLPMTGITLPFVSHGGWSLVTSFSMLGIWLAISHRNALAVELSPHPGDPL